MNSLLRSFFSSIIAVSYIELHTPLMRHVLVGVVVGDAQLLYPQCEPALSGINMRMILRVPTLA